LDNPEDPFRPKRRPVLIGFAQQPDRYTFQLWPTAANGQLYNVGREHHYGSFTDALNIQPYRFKNEKVNNPFMNDPIPPLYLATRLWMSVFPSVSGGRGTTFTASTGALAMTVKEMYGRGTVKDVGAAMKILDDANLAKWNQKESIWVVKRVSLKSQDVHHEIAERLRPKAVTTSIAPKKPRRRPATSQPREGQDELFAID
jgi:hypothetical protein